MSSNRKLELVSLEPKNIELGQLGDSGGDLTWHLSSPSLTFFFNDINSKFTWAQPFFKTMLYILKFAYGPEYIESSIIKGAPTFNAKVELTVKGAAEDSRWGISVHNHTQSRFFGPHHANCIDFSSKSTWQKHKYSIYFVQNIIEKRHT